MLLCYYVVIIPVLGRQRLVDLRFTANQSNLPDELQANERTCLKQNKRKQTISQGGWSNQLKIPHDDLCSQLVFYTNTHRKWQFSVEFLISPSQFLPYLDCVCPCPPKPPS